MVLTKSTNKTEYQVQNDHKIAIVVSQFNPEICENLKQGACSLLEKTGFNKEQITVYEVAGAFEIPFMAQQIANTKKYKGIVALGCVIKGDTPHFDYVCDAVTRGCLRVGLDTNCPVAFGVITVNNQAQAIERASMNEFNKGREACIALLNTIATMEKL